jgi:integrase
MASALRYIARKAVTLPSLSGATVVTSPKDLDAERLNELKEIVDGDTAIGTNRKNYVKSIIVRLPYWNDRLPDGMRWSTPEWADNKWQERRSGPANQERPIPQAVMAPLLEWSLTLVAAADEILAAYQEGQRLLSRAEKAPQDRSKAREILAEYKASGKPLPAVPNDDGTPSRYRAARYLAAVHGVSARSISMVGTEEFASLPLTVQRLALPVPIGVTLHGKQWIDSIGFYDVVGRKSNVLPPLIRHLVAASLIAIAYLTGMRPQEVTALRIGCCLQPRLTESGRLLHLIRGHIFKGRSDGASWEGYDASDEGVWATIAEAVRAVEAMERLAALQGRTDGTLFPVRSTTGPTTPIEARADIASLIQFVNTRLVPHHENNGLLIPSDDEDITLRRFRRTLAWFIRNQPQGDVTLAIQYQHLNTTIGEGYASTAASGFPELLEEEGWNNRKRVLAHLREAFAEGEAISGPGAPRIVNAVRALPEVVSERAERELMKDPTYAVYANPFECSYCAADPESLLCKERDAVNKPKTPNLASCRGQVCPNFAATDENAVDLAVEARALREAADAASPVRKLSLEAKAAEAEAIVERHRRSRWAPAEQPPEVSP